MFDLIAYLRCEEHIPDREMIKDLYKLNLFSNGNIFLKSFIKTHKKKSNSKKKKLNNHEQ